MERDKDLQREEKEVRRKYVKGEVEIERKKWEIRSREEIKERGETKEDGKIREERRQGNKVINNNYG